jgi:hypothetical protein
MVYKLKFNFKLIYKLNALIINLSYNNKNKITNKIFLLLSTNELSINNINQNN